ncbi:MAG: ATP-dependent DNA helicase RecG [Pusillimonas sp.]|mgnify:CR=1 FL=1|nr:ATP-dependent DNA helicase RecG [Pusillimonas sp.]
MPEPEPKAVAQSSSSAIERRLQRLGLHSNQDCVIHLPIRYEDETQLHTVASARVGQTVQLEGQIAYSEVQLRPRRQLVAMLRDETGSISLRWLHFYPSQQKQVAKGKLVRVRGEIRSGFNGLEIVHPRVSKAGGALAATLTPVYPTTEGLTQAKLRKIIGQALENADFSDTLPEAVRQRFQLIGFAQAVRTLHHPPANITLASLEERTHPAWQRIKFDELLAQQLSLALARALRLQQKALPLVADHTNLFKTLRGQLPFQLTGAQERVIAEITHDLARPYPMHRLLQGDVGSGKTIVAAFAALKAIASKTQVAVMAPTELLAEQHFHKLSAWMSPLGIKVQWLSGSQKSKGKQEILNAIACGDIQLVVGTQALIQTSVEFHRLGLVILDEQHRFGVGQRLALGQKGEQQTDTTPLLPHQLNMSATPIPRTLAMTLFADLDVSVLDALPPGRQAVVTKLLADNRRDELIAHIYAEIKKGRQVYWVCPLVEESEALQLQTAVDTHAYLQSVLPDLSIGMVHGRLKSAEKTAVMDAFRSGEISLLVATTVIEVGVDVPNATLMVIEHAERFGLAQLHQLRGRVGRGAAQSVCVLLYQPPLSAVARQRLRAMYETSDGFEIARRDLAIRGPGEFLGLRQSGVPLLRFADIETDSRLVQQAQALAAELLANARDVAQAHLDRWMQGKHVYLRS